MGLSRASTRLLFHAKQRVASHPDLIAEETLARNGDRWWGQPTERHIRRGEKTRLEKETGKFRAIRSQMYYAVGYVQWKEATRALRKERRREELGTLDDSAQDFASATPRRPVSFEWSSNIWFQDQETVRSAFDNLSLRMGKKAGGVQAEQVVNQEVDQEDQKESDAPLF
eukprot:GILJ01001828.1.p1 GENE.GILJ01001828.1~~GILJ01001828.1.p1  ORF type:complete len:170 (+),score=17.20 GILJ01001828.1:35-544(+)